MSSPSALTDTTTGPPTVPDHVHGGRRFLLLGARALSYLVYAFVVFVEIILAFGFFLLLFGANASSGFVAWVYRSLDRAMSPFRGMFTPIDLGNTPGNEVTSVFDTSVLFAMIVYALLALLVGGFIEWLTGRLERLDREDAKARRRAEYDRLIAAQAPTATSQYPAAAVAPGVSPD